MEDFIKELNHGSFRKMLKSGTNKWLWEHRIKLEALVCSHTVLDVYELQGQVPEAIMTGQTPGISNLCKYEWFQWVVYYDIPLSCPDDKCKLRHYFGPAIDVVSLMTYNVLKANDEYDCWSTM